MDARHVKSEDLKFYVVYILIAIIVVLGFATLQIHFVMGVAFADFEVALYVVPATVGGLFGFLVARVKVLQKRTETYLEKIIDSERQLHAEIDERKAIEESLRKYSQKLKALNQDLSAFSSSVSHDLRTPLRSIMGFSQALLEDYESQLDNRARDYLHRIHNACTNMGELIEALLNMARASQLELNKRDINLTYICEVVAQGLKEQERDRNIDIVIQPELMVTADEHLLKIVITNLLSNAWKFTRDTENARIEIGSYQKDDNQVYFVRDNGVGFDKKFVNKLFVPFSRLHHDDMFQGTGIGLATVQRIVQRHGGRIWAEGEVNKGAGFYFTLQPRNEVSLAQAAK